MRREKSLIDCTEACVCHGGKPPDRDEAACHVPERRCLAKMRCSLAFGFVRPAAEVEMSFNVRPGFAQLAAFAPSFRKLLKVGDLRGKARASDAGVPAITFTDVFSAWRPGTGW